MQVEIYLGLLKNIEILLILSILYQISSYFEHRFGRFKSIVTGIIIGLMGIFVMSYAYVFQSGLIFDTRSILIASVALFFSTTTLLISSIMMITYRLYMGGIGMLPGIAVILLTSAIGWLWRKNLFDVKILPRWVSIYLYGILVHVVMMLTMYLLPYPLAMETVRSFGTPILMLYPIATLVISSLMLLQKKHNESLDLIRNAEQKYSSLFNNQHLAMIVTDPQNGQLIDANPAAVKFYGWSKDDLLQKNISEINGLTFEQNKSEMEKAKKQKKTVFISKHLKSDGKTVDVEVFSGPVSLDNKQLLYSTIIDVSSRLLYEEEMKRNLDLFRTVVENSLDAIFIQVGRRFVYLNPAALRLFKVQEESNIIGTRILDRIHPDYHEEVNHIMSQADYTRKPVSSTQWIFLTINNKPVTVETVAVPIDYNGQHGTLVITHDITTRLETLSALLSSEMNFRSVVKNMPIPVFIYQNSKIAFLNRAAVKFFGATNDEDLIGSPFRKFVPENDSDGITKHIQKVFNSKTDVSLQRQQFIRMDGSPIFAQVGAVHINYDGLEGALVFARDLTEEMEMEKRKIEWEMQIQQKQRLESIGVLAGGVAHEINNPINGIMNYAQLIIDEAQQEDIIDEYVNQILKESQRISDIVKNLLQFSRHEKHAFSYSSFYDIIENTLLLIKVIFKNDQIDLRLTAEEDLPDIKCRSQQIQQVFMNLMTNARDSLNEKYPTYHDSKIIEVDVSLKNVDDSRWVYLSVKDYGLGINDEVKARLFEPFFSTKPKHIGTGLGLAISFGIVEDHHGKIMIDSVVGEYTMFTVALPVDNGWDITDRRN
jgi:PAS domain S-box-containing protein